MAVVGHWFSAFLAAYFVPEASVVLLMKLSMLSDTVAALLLPIGVENIGIYAQWLMSTPPPGTDSLLEEWKATGRWEKGVDQMPAQNGFKGFGAVFPFYVGLSYSHSVELMVIMSLPTIAVLAVLRRGISMRYALAILCVAVSHPLLDMLFHDAYFIMGNRAKTRVSLGLWNYDWLAPILFVAELLAAYIPYRLWLSTREPISMGKETLESIVHNHKLFWSISINHNMVSFYILGPVMQWAFYRFTTWDFGANNEWTAVLFCIMILSWSAALYPIHKFEGLYQLKGSSLGYGYVQV